MAPLDPEADKVIWESPEDPPAKQLNAIKEEYRDRHFPTCDEIHLELFEPHVRNLGGAYVGVGSDQAYLLIGWMRPEVAWLMDYDQWISDLHRVYRSFFLTAPDVAAFMALWKDPVEGRKAIDQVLATDPRREEARKAFDSARGIVGRRLSWVQRTWAKQKTKSFLTDPETYTYIREMIQARRIRPLVGNLLGDKGMAGLAETTRKLGIPIRVLYVSNAEDYWRYPDSFRRNILGLPVDERSVFLRTTASKPANGDFRYWVQPIRNLQEWLKLPRVKSAYHMLPYVPIKDPEDVPITLITQLPDPKKWGDKTSGTAK